MHILTVAEMQALEQAAYASGLAYETMMENAGYAVAQAIREHCEFLSRILILVGPGNNGGDGLVAARYLQEWGFETTVYVWRRAKQDDPNLTRAQKAGVTLLWADQDDGGHILGEQARCCHVLVDALLGTGAVGTLRGTLRELITRVHQSLNERTIKGNSREISLRDPHHAPEPVHSDKPYIVAVDVPSGLDCDSGFIDDLALHADLTVTFAYPKRGHYLYPGAAHVGRLLVADIGIDPTLAANYPWQIAIPETVAALLPARPPEAHKGTFGKALIIGGSANYVGAPRLSAEAAYRSGAGLVTLAVGETIYPIVAARMLEPTFLVLPDDLGALIPDALKVLIDNIKGYDALLIGPGLGTEEKTGEFLHELLMGQMTGHRPIGFRHQPDLAMKRMERVALPPIVLDADGLNLLKYCPAWWQHLPKGSVITPHPGEMARLLACNVGQVNANRFEVASRAATQWGCVVVLKGAYTIIAAPDGRGVVIPFANPALATAGTGDVLAGAIVGLMAQGMRGYEAAVCGAYLHGLAGELRREQIGHTGMLAGDLLPLLPEAIQRLLKR